MSQPRDIEAWKIRLLKRLKFFSDVLDTKGFPILAEEIRNIQTETELRQFYDALKIWLF